MPTKRRGVLSMKEYREMAEDFGETSLPGPPWEGTDMWQARILLAAARRIQRYQRGTRGITSAWYFAKKLRLWAKELTDAK